MRRSLGYADAVRLLGGKSPALELLDHLTRGALLAASGGASEALSLFDARSEAVRLGADLLGPLRDRMRGLSRYSRTERLEAAHAVLVVAAYFEALNEAELPFDPRRLDLTRADQISLATGEKNHHPRRPMLGGTLPTPLRPAGSTEAALRTFYADLSINLLALAECLKVWDDLDAAGRLTLASAFTELPERAIGRYREHLRRLATDFPELAFWFDRLDHEATRAELAELRTGLAGLATELRTVSAGRAPDARRAALARAYTAELDRPILRSGSVPDGLRLPTLGEGYINPRFEARDDRPRVQAPASDDLQAMLTGHLTHPDAVHAPVLLLGQPGSGKSVLTKVLAARLPAADFLAVRVPLREVPADADVQAQIEHAVLAATGETVGWPELARSAGDALPVVLLDGFDELLQATGLNRSDYLERVAAFQEREAGQGRPVAVLVTSRSAVAHQARRPEGTVAVELRPFGEEEIAAWLDVWNGVNAGAMASPLLPSHVRAHPELTGQPLLLLMLALYDGTDARLQRPGRPLTRAELYERLMLRFTEREVLKDGASLPDDERLRRVRLELLRLAVVALAMFNRGRQWVTEDDLDADLAALLGAAGPDPGHGSGRPERHVTLSAGQLVLGRFFFVHETQALADRRLRTYEFLHATFGEFLIAWLLAGELTHLGTEPDDAFLHAVASWVPFTGSAPISEILASMSARWPRPERERVRRALAELLRRSGHERRDSTYADYRPQDVRVPRRHATYSANLLLCLVLTAGEEVSTFELFPEAESPTAEWRRIARSWYAEFDVLEWEGLITRLRPRRRRSASGHELLIGLDSGGEPLSLIDAIAPGGYDAGTGLPGMDSDVDIPPEGTTSLVVREAAFLCSPSLDLLLDGITPYLAYIDALGLDAHEFNDPELLASDLVGGPLDQPLVYRRRLHTLLAALLTPPDRITDREREVLLAGTAADGTVFRFFEPIRAAARKLETLRGDVPTAEREPPGAPARRIRLGDSREGGARLGREG